MIRKKTYINSNFLLQFIGLLGFITLSIFFKNEGFIFNENNEIISYVITILFFIGSIWLIHLSFNLFSEEKEANTLLDRENYISSPQDIELLALKLKNSWIKDRISRIIRITEIKGQIDTNSLSKITENQVCISANIVKYISSAVLLIGLLGTFLGLIQSVQGLQSALNHQEISSKSQINIGTTKDDDVESLYVNMSGTLGGLDKAFGTSIAGIIASIILSLLYIGYKITERLLINKIEAISTILITPYFQRKETDTIAIIIAETINRTLPTIIKEATEDLKLSTENLEKATQLLKSDQNTFFKIAQSIEAETNRFISENEKFTTWLIKFLDVINIIKESQISIKNSYDSLKNDLVKFETSFDQYNLQINETMRSSQNIIFEMSKYLKTKDEKLEDIVKLNNEAFSGIGQVYEMLKDTIVKLNLDIKQNQEQSYKFWNENKNILLQLNTVHTKLENAYSSLENYSTKKDQNFKEIINETFVTNLKTTEIMDKISSKLKDQRKLIEIIQQGITQLSNKVDKFAAQKPRIKKVMEKPDSTISIRNRFFNIFKSRK